MNTLNAVQIAELAVLRGNGESGFVVLDLYNAGNPINWLRQFPSMTDDQREMLDSATFLQCETRKEACDLFQSLTKDCGDNGTGGIISGTITLVVPDARHDDEVETLTWELDEKTRPVLDGTTWRDEMIVDRI